jgi:hypothetical protein
VRAVLPPGLAGTILVGRNSSDHAAQVGRYLIEMSTGRPVSLAPSVLLRNGARLDLGGYLVVAVSQSGRTPEIADYLARARGAGARTLAITNDAASAVARAAERELDLRVGEGALQLWPRPWAVLIADCSAHEHRRGALYGPDRGDASHHGVGAEAAGRVVAFLDDDVICDELLAGGRGARSSDRSPLGPGRSRATSSTSRPGCV